MLHSVKLLSSNSTGITPHLRKSSHLIISGGNCEKEGHAQDVDNIRNQEKEEEEDEEEKDDDDDDDNDDTQF